MTLNIAKSFWADAATFWTEQAMDTLSFLGTTET